MKKLMSSVLLVISALALSTAAFADIPSVPRPAERSSSLWIVLLIVAVVIIAAVILFCALRRRKK